MTMAGPSTSRSTTRRYLKIARELADQIDKGDYPVGMRLPPERELAVTMGVSRTVLREALLALEIRGYVEVRIGSGVFVLPESYRTGPSRGDIEEMRDAAPFDVLEMRRMAEGEAAFMAAQRATDEQMAALEEALADMEASLEDVTRYDVADARFHAIIGEASGNQLLQALMRQLWDYRYGEMWSLWYNQTRSITNRRNTVVHHRRILAAIQRGLPDVARTAMQAHMDEVNERFFALVME
ncbi:FadR/GntR family transcriptional regulator [Salipiger sp. PrR002]|uniref:FadR/GntR family transcriptional regulator n=1 Tax=Salipiger sp. PrR002 TaxID=2706489 RepID=UPI0013B90D39|nr:FadR/GntR family transcriptional regulator [Salipiger sp. PrR002]NDW01751.1 FadR family transcriptional regulator [Salipiger sp. PrR002]NDW57812.1 FadR family transcriptional regulator [Salipiger sp. PrR004]